MAILLSMPGRHGDLLWAMATARAIAEANPGEAIDLAISQKYGGIADLLRQQPYLRAVWVIDSWQVEETAPMTPRIPPEDRLEAWVRLQAEIGDRSVWHIPLGYKGWPAAPLAQEVWNTVRAEHPDLPIAELDLDRPWISAPHPIPRPTDGAAIAAGFSDEYFEVKYGLHTLVKYGVAWNWWATLAAPGSRWEREGGIAETSWIAAANRIATASVFLGCCSALHVLAVALGKSVVCLEPNPQRWQDIFYPLGKTGRVRLVLGGDGQPTHDARHTIDAIREVLHATK